MIIMTATTVTMPNAIAWDVLCTLLDVETHPMAKNDTDVMRVTRQCLAVFDLPHAGETVTVDQEIADRAVAVLRMAKLRPAFQGVPGIWRALFALDPFRGE
jgi:hypothetical protein